MRRCYFDGVALIVHLVTSTIGLITAPFLFSISGACLVAMELISFIFCGTYVTCARGSPGKPRKIKWIDHALTTSLAAIAVLLAESRVHYDWILLFTFTSFAKASLESLIDSTLDFSISWASVASLSLLSVGEFIFIALAGDNYRRVFFWTFVAFNGLLILHSLVGFNARSKEDYMEEIYSLLNLIKKVAVFYALYFDIVGVSEPWIATGSSVLFLATLVYAGLEWRITKKIKKSFSLPNLRVKAFL